MERQETRTLIMMVLGFALLFTLLGFMFWSINRTGKETFGILDTYSITSIEVHEVRIFTGPYGIRRDTSGWYATLSNGQTWAVGDELQRYIPRVGEKLDPRFVRYRITKAKYHQR